MIWCLLEITQPEFVIHITEASCIILPVAEKLQPATLASEENLQEEDNKKKWLMLHFTDHQTFPKNIMYEFSKQHYLQKTPKNLGNILDIWHIETQQNIYTNFTKERNHNLANIVLTYKNIRNSVTLRPIRCVKSKHVLSVKPHLLCIIYLAPVVALTLAGQRYDL